MKLSITLLTTLALFFLSSCKKEYTCNCEIYAFGQLQTTQSELLNDTKMGARKTCKSRNGKNQYTLGDFTIDTESKCAIQ